MKTMSWEQMEMVNGGDWKNTVDVGCLSVMSGTAAYGLGVVAHWWNPIGWVSAACLVVDAACTGWGIGRL